VQEEQAMTMHMKPPAMIEGSCTFEVDQTEDGPITVATAKVAFPGMPEKFAIEIQAASTASEEHAVIMILSPTSKRGLLVVRL
jgi:hypothetical protein